MARNRLHIQRYNHKLKAKLPATCMSIFKFSRAEDSPKSGHHIQQRALAGARRTHDGCEFARPEAAVQAMKDLLGDCGAIRKYFNIENSKWSEAEVPTELPLREGELFHCVAHVGELDVHGIAVVEVGMRHRLVVVRTLESVQVVGHLAGQLAGASGRGRWRLVDGQLRAGRRGATVDAQATAVGVTMVTLEAADAGTAAGIAVRTSHAASGIRCLDVWQEGHVCTESSMFLVRRGIWNVTRRNELFRCVARWSKVQETAKISLINADVFEYNQ